MTLAINTQWDLDNQVRKLQGMIDEAEGSPTSEAALLSADLQEAGYRVELRFDKVWVAPHPPLPEGPERTAERPTGFEIE